MKVLFTADLHINLTKKNVPTHWQVGRYTSLFDDIEKIVIDNDVGLIVLGGDIFDKYPTLEELCLYFDMIRSFNVETIIFDGNHEATKRGESFLHLLSDVSSAINSHIRILTEPTTIYGMDFIPYTHIKTFNPLDFLGDVLFTHVRGEIKPHVKPEIDLSKLSRWQLVLAGDLHSNSNSQLNIVYPGSPLTVTFHRGKVETGVILFDDVTMELDWIKLKQPQLIRKRVTNEDEMVKTDFDHTIYELEGEARDLSKTKANALLDKKIVRNSHSAELDFSPDDTIEDEIVSYLLDVKGLGQEEVDRVLRRHNDNIAKFKME